MKVDHLESMVRTKIVEFKMETIIVTLIRIKIKVEWKIKVEQAGFKIRVELVGSKSGVRIILKMKII